MKEQKLIETRIQPLRIGPDARSKAAEFSETAEAALARNSGAIGWNLSWTKHSAASAADLLAEEGIRIAEKRLHHLDGTTATISTIGLQKGDPSNGRSAGCHDWITSGTTLGRKLPPPCP